jgi:threonine dehydratase
MLVPTPLIRLGNVFPNRLVFAKCELLQVEMALVPEDAIRAARRELFETQGLGIEPSSSVPLAFVKAHKLQEPICGVLTGENITREDHRRLISGVT